MDLGRRLFIVGLASWAACRGAVAADAGSRGVFWTVRPPGAASTVLFAYDRVALSASESILRIGRRLADPTRHLVADMPNCRFPTGAIDLGRPVPLAARYDAPAVARIRDVIRQLPGKPPDPETLPGVLLVLLLAFEGQTRSDLRAGGSLSGRFVAEAQAEGKPVAYLRPYAEVAATYRPPDFAAIDRAVTEPVVAYLLALRDRVGAIGKYMETLYVTERPYDLYRVMQDMNAHGVPFDALVADQRGGAAPILAEILDRAERAIRTAGKPTFLMLPVVDVVRPGGLLARLQAAGIKAEIAG